MPELDWIKGFALKMGEGTEEIPWTERYLSRMKNMYADGDACREILEKQDPLIYRFHELGAPEEDGVLSFGITELMPGKVGNEYYMTKGHFHKKLMTSEIYLCLSGSGMLMLENMEGDWKVIPMKEMEAVYVPAGYAHRSINTGNEVLRMFFVYGADAGHDYNTIETKGFRHLVTEQDKETAVIENPAWQAASE